MSNVHYLTPHIAKVLLPLAVAEPFDYVIAQEMTLSLGDYVRVPFRGGHKVGVVWGLPEGKSDVPANKLKEVEAKIELPPMPEPLMKLIDWVADYTLSFKGMVLKMAISVPEVFGPSINSASPQLIMSALPPHASGFWRL